jgi:murein DD-endopeptidase MepM/ murein hydrolase activator NlpD
MPRGANAGQLYAAVYLPGIARNRNWQGALSRRGEDYYDDNPSLDQRPKDGVIDFNDLARVISERRVELGLGPSPSLTSNISAQGFASPVRGALAMTDTFGSRGGEHLGLDIDGETGDPIMAVLGGRVERAGDSGGNAGIRVNIKHDNGMETRYMHLSRADVAVGQRVTIGQQIGLMGSTGRSTGSHLHLELFVGGRRVNPEPYIRGARSLAAMTPSSTPRTPTAEDNVRLAQTLFQPVGEWGTPLKQQPDYTQSQYAHLFTSDYWQVQRLR